MKNSLYFIVTRGLPGSGKSTFCEKYLNDFVIICPDEYRLKLNGIVTINGKEQISQENANKIWNKVLNNIRCNLAINKNVVLDATSCRVKDIKKYLKLANEYKATFLILDFSSIDIETCKERNNTRLPEYKRVSEETLERMNTFLKVELPENLKSYIIKYNEFKKENLNA